MANMVDLIIRLEKRLIVLEMLLGITAEPNDLIHPKSLTQAQAINGIRDKIEVKK